VGTGKGYKCERKKKISKNLKKKGYQEITKCSDILVSLQIWSFSMKAACCRQEIVIHTDPKNCEYVIISGAERKNEEFDAEDAETLALPAEEGLVFRQIALLIGCKAVCLPFDYHNLISCLC